MASRSQDPTNQSTVLRVLDQWEWTSLLLNLRRVDTWSVLVCLGELVWPSYRGELFYQLFCYSYCRLRSWEHLGNRFLSNFSNLLWNVDFVNLILLNIKFSQIAEEIGVRLLVTSLPLWSNRILHTANIWPIANYFSRLLNFANDFPLISVRQSWVSLLKSNLQDIFVPKLRMKNAL